MQGIENRFLDLITVCVYWLFEFSVDKNNAVASGGVAMCMAAAQQQQHYFLFLVFTEESSLFFTRVKSRRQQVHA